MQFSPRLSGAKGVHLSRVWNKILYVTWDESRFFCWVVTALAKRFFPWVITALAGKICYFRPLLHNVLLLTHFEKSKKIRAFYNNIQIYSINPSYLFHNIIFYTIIAL